MSLASLARSYLRHGWSMVPVHVPVGGGCTCGRRECDTPGKHPRGPWRQYHTKRPTKAEVEDWLTSYDPLNIGIVTGRVSGLVVVDVDMPNPDTIREELGLPPTLTAITGGGGRHYFYTCDKKVKGVPGWESGVDIRAEGGFVVAAPSLHESGNRYKWSVKTAPVPFPSELLSDRLSESNGEDRSANEVGWHRELLQGVEAGTRSYAATRLAGRYAKKDLDEIETRMLLYVWNDLNDPPLPAAELRRIVKWVYDRNEQETAAMLEWARERKG